MRRLRGQHRPQRRGRARPTGGAHVRRRPHGHPDAGARRHLGAARDRRSAAARGHDDRLRGGRAAPGGDRRQVVRSRAQARPGAVPDRPRRPRRRGVIPPNAGGGVEFHRDVLVVDDDEGVRSTLVDILTLAGLTVAASASAREAMAEQTTAPARVAVVDYRLPDATGLELATRLKLADPDLPVIVLTGNASLETAVAAVGHVDDYLTKPVPPARLLQTVRLGLERRRLVWENRDLLSRLTEANLTLEARVRERTEQLRADRERLSDAQRTARIGSWEWDFAEGALTTSVELRRLYGLDSRREVSGYEELFEHVPAEDHARIQTSVFDAVAHRR